jgi:hypothetical protein
MFDIKREKTSQAFRDALYGGNKSTCAGGIASRCASQMGSFNRMSTDHKRSQICSKSSHELIQKYLPGFPSSVNIVSHTNLDSNYPEQNSTGTPNDCFDLTSRTNKQIMNTLLTDITRPITNALDYDQAHIIDIRDNETNELLQSYSRPLDLVHPQQLLNTNVGFMHNESHSYFGSSGDVKKLDNCIQQTNIRDADASNISLFPQLNRMDDNVEAVITPRVITNEEINVNRVYSNRRGSLEWENLLYVKTCHDWCLASHDNPFDS